ncbi:MAG TPA: CNNM domain-containing protein [Verrucomicrobiae bacterium]|nr:CNNM domain-containing protein [Verrucomicrobiae bacterium]
MENNFINWLSWSALVLCLVFSFLLSGMEAGVFALNRLRVRRLARGGQPSAQLLNRFLQNPERFLWTILVGNTLANFLILGWILTQLHAAFYGRPVLESGLFAVAVFFFYTLFDLLPKMLFRARPNQLCLSMAWIFRLVYFVLSVPVLIVEDVSKTILRWTGGRTFTGRLFGNREEMLAIIQESSQSLTSDERAMINRVLDLQNLTVRKITKPIAQTVTVEANTPLRQVLALAREKKLSRLPVWENRDGQRRVAGLIEANALLFHENLDLEKPVATHMTPALFINENVRLETALRLIQRAGHRLAIVLSRERKEIGVIALEDILKILFGEVKL